MILDNAKWITAELETDKSKRYPAQYLKKSFSYHLKNESKAVLSITSHGLYEAYVNNKKVSDYMFEPGPGNYNDRLEYRTYEIGSLLEDGKNEIMIILSDGWYRGCNGIDGQRNLFGIDASVICAISDNNDIVLLSDESWEGSGEGPIRFSDLEQGEIYDARMENIKDWHKVKVLSFNNDNLIESSSLPIKMHERFDGKIIKTPNGETVIDYSQNLAGFSSFRVYAHEGDKITLWHGETLDENGNFTQKNYDPGKRNKEGGIPQKIEYICKEGLNEYHPSFSIFGYRYAKIETTVDLSSSKFESIAVYSDMEELSKFECSNEKLNRLFLNSLWSMKSNFLGIPTDCPTRERAGWSGDAGVFVDTGLLLMDSRKVFEKWLAECEILQGKNGIIPNIAPRNNESGIITKLIKGSAGWGDASVIIPMTIYNYYGDRSVLERFYPMMKKWVDFTARRASKTKLKNLFKDNPYKKYTVDKGMHFGEWCEPDINSIDAMKSIISKGAPELATAYFFYSSRLLSEAAKTIGKEEDYRKYSEISENARKAWRHITLVNGEIKSDRQADYVRPIAFGLLDEQESKDAASTLNSMILKNDYHLNTGFLSTPYLLKVLSDYGYTETAYKLLLQESCPSWLYAITKGSTTIWEKWDGIDENGIPSDSLNHYSYGAVSSWLIKGMCGINYNNGSITISPKVSRQIEYAKAEYQSPKGRIYSSWKMIDNERTEFTIEIPDGSSAIFAYSGIEPKTLKSGKHTFVL